MVRDLATDHKTVNIKDKNKKNQNNILTKKAANPVDIKS